ncbi:MAG: fructosamine kinase family protein [Flavobacteriia bacterium]|nr:fructosamine kinase family protein [Flavobacteriia bacterium]
MNEIFRVDYNFFNSFFERKFSQNQTIRPTRLAGGDIHDVFSFDVEGEWYVIKVNQKMPADVFLKEAEGLKALRETGVVQVPNVLDVDEIDGVQYLLLEHVAKGSSMNPEFGSELARMHRFSSENFGWSSDNYIGSLPQENSPSSSWSEFFVESRLNPLVRRLRDSGKLGQGEARVFSLLESRIESLFPIEPPALLHGELWSGNALVDEKGSTWLIDPAVYYGHREMDLGMMRLFGGFHADVFQQYNFENPLEPDFEERVRLTRLYPILVHTVLFGGPYLSEAREIAKQYC